MVIKKMFGTYKAIFLKLAHSHGIKQNLKKNLGVSKEKQKREKNDKETTRNVEKKFYFLFYCKSRVQSNYLMGGKGDEFFFKEKKMKKR